MILYLRNIVPEVARRQWMVHIVTTDAALDHPAYSLLNQECGDYFTVSTMPAVRFPAAAPSVGNLLRYQLRQFRAFADAYGAIRHQVQPDVVYLNDLNCCDKAMGLLGSPFAGSPLIATLLGIKFHHRSMDVISVSSRNDWLNEKLFARLLRVRSLMSLLQIDPLLVPYVERKSLKGSEKVRYVPDIAHLSGNITRQQARRALAINDEQIVVLVYGSLDARKGIKSLVAALRQLGSTCNVVALVAGEPQGSVRQLLAEKEVTDLIEFGMLQISAGFLNDEREFAVFKAADIVWLGYEGFCGMSGVLLQAGLAGLPVIACKQGLIGWFARNHGLGEIVDTADPADIAVSLQRLATDPQMRRSYGEHGRRLAINHAPRRFADNVCDAIFCAANGK